MSYRNITFIPGSATEFEEFRIIPSLKGTRLRMVDEGGAELDSQLYYLRGPAAAQAAFDGAKAAQADLAAEAKKKRNEISHGEALESLNEAAKTFADALTDDRLPEALRNLLPPLPAGTAFPDLREAAFFKASTLNEGEHVSGNPGVVSTSTTVLSQVLQRDDRVLMTAARGMQPRIYRLFRSDHTELVIKAYGHISHQSGAVTFVDAEKQPIARFNYFDGWTLVPLKSEPIAPTTDSFSSTLRRAELAIQHLKGV